MNVVVDASAIAAVVFHEADGNTVQAHVRDDTLFAPHLIDYELMNVGLVKIRRGIGNELLIRGMLSKVPFLRIRRVRVPTDAVIPLALQTGLSGYDAAYLWLAHSMDVQLVTLDRKLASADRSLRGDPA
jgi:predicted nucleic acid-binding protein